MYKKIYLLPLLLILASLFIGKPATAQTEEKSLKDSWNGLKKTLHPDKAFIMPFIDSTSEDLHAFLFAVKEIKSVKNATLKIDGEKIIIAIEAKSSMLSIWNNLDKEMRNRYIISESTPNGLVLSDIYQPGVKPTKN